VGRRIPLMRAMRDVAKVDASLPRDRVVSVDEAIAIHERLTRRDLLLGAPTLGAATALAGSPAAALARPPRPSEHDPRIVIVGAGLAGLSCAYELHTRGVRADVFEARDRIGGRCWTARGFAYGQTAEHGGEFIDTRHIHVRWLAAKLGLRLEARSPGTKPKASQGGAWWCSRENAERWQRSGMVSGRWFVGSLETRLASARTVGIARALPHERSIEPRW
jgi:NADPH-dependent 2,4-dienoyl-CoA reductase/sulfur reductase-like enzyme